MLAKYLEVGRSCDATARGQVNSKEGNNYLRKVDACHSCEKPYASASTGISSSSLTHCAAGAYCHDAPQKHDKAG